MSVQAIDAGVSATDVSANDAPVQPSDVVLCQEFASCQCCWCLKPVGHNDACGDYLTCITGVRS